MFHSYLFVFSYNCWYTICTLYCTVWYMCLHLQWPIKNQCTFLRLFKTQSIMVTMTTTTPLPMMLTVVSYLTSTMCRSVFCFFLCVCVRVPAVYLSGAKLKKRHAKANDGNLPDITHKHFIFILLENTLRCFFLFQYRGLCVHVLQWY